MIFSNKLRNTKIQPLHVLPTKHLHIKYGLIISLLGITLILNNRLNEVVTKPMMCSNSISIPIGIKQVSSNTIEAETLYNKLQNTYGVPEREAIKIVNTALIQANPVFPTVYDILAIIAIESKFNITAQSSTSSAKGLMQVLYKKTSFDIEQNISDGVNLLINYKQTLGSTTAVVQAYNLGIGGYLNGGRNQDYLNRFQQEKQRLMQ